MIPLKRLFLTPILLFLALVLPVLNTCKPVKSPLAVSTMTCEYMVNPLGIETQSPRLSWQLTSVENGQYQTSYQVMVASHPDGLKKNEPDAWNSGRVEGPMSLHIIYQGSELAAGQRYWWKVLVWDRNGEQAETGKPAFFEMGLLSSGDWKGAEWIRLDEDPRESDLKKRMVKTNGLAWFEDEMVIRNQDDDPPVMRASYPAAHMRKEFRLEETVEDARLYVCGLGYHEVFVNGQRLGDAVLDPGQTTYDKRAYYIVHDVKSVLQKDQNAIGILLGNGFFGQNIGFNAAFLDYGKPAMKCMLRVSYDDGSEDVLVSDRSWKATTGPIIYDNVYAGETYDARAEIPGWDSPGFDDKEWFDVALVDSVSPKLTAQLIPPIKKIKYLKPIDLWETSKGKMIFDLGQNIAGWAKIRVNEEAGTKITLRFSEITSPDKQKLNLTTIGTRATGVDQREIYVCKGGGEEVWEPRFTYHGFRYIEVEGLSDPSLESLEGCLVRTDVERNGTFESSDELLNSIYATSLWTIEDNLHSVPEDCPHREKCGWLGDAHASVEVMNYNYNMAQFWTKFMKDVESTMGSGGMTYEMIPATAGIPCNISVGRRLCQEARPDWGSAIILVPWANYQFYGNTRMLEENYAHMVRWMAYLKEYLEDDILYQGYGDWCPPGSNRQMDCPVALSSTAYYHRTLVLISKISEMLGESGNAQAYSDEARVVKFAFNKKFYDEGTGTYGSQTGTSLALDLGLVPEGNEKKVAHALAEVEVNQKKAGHFSTGIHGAKRLYKHLTAYGFENEVFTMLRNKDFPSYQYLFDHDFTTWPETFYDYEADTENRGRGSHNHPMQSGFAMWFHEYLGGIRILEESPAFKKFVIQPHGIHYVDQVSTSYDAVYGKIVSNWKTSDSKFELDVEIPVNTTALVFVPAINQEDVSVTELQKGSAENIRIMGFKDAYLCFEVASGSYRFESAL